MCKTLELAKTDAEWAIQLWPSWWRGYFRLGRAQKELHELKDAEKSFNIALALNPKEKQILDELSHVRSIVCLPNNIIIKFYLIFSD